MTQIESQEFSSQYQELLVLDVFDDEVAFWTLGEVPPAHRDVRRPCQIVGESDKLPPGSQSEADVGDQARGGEGPLPGRKRSLAIVCATVFVFEDLPGPLHYKYLLV